MPVSTQPAPAADPTAPVRPSRGRAPRAIRPGRVPAAALLGARRRGRPLDPGLRAEMEALFATSFASVRVRVGPEAPALDAAAFACGETLCFAPGFYRPDTPAGRAMLLHELTHIVQQRAGRARVAGTTPALLDDPALEAEADAVAAGASPPSCPPGARARPRAIQRIHYTAAKQVGASYVREEGQTSAHRSASNPRLARLEAELKLLLVDYNTQMSQLALQRNGLGFITNRSKNRAAECVIRKIAAEIAQRKRFLELQGLKLHADGSIDWLNSRLVVLYDHDLSKQGLTRVAGRGGRLVWESTGTEVDTGSMSTFFSGTGHAIFAMSEQGNIHMHNHVIGGYHHSSLLRGGAVACAGEIKVVDGRVTWLSNKSGHYRPSTVHLSQVVHQLGRLGIPPSYDVQDFQMGTSNYELLPAGQFLARTDAEHDYELIKLLSYSIHFTSPALAALGMVWDNGARTFRSTMTGVPMSHRAARRALKQAGLRPNSQFLNSRGGLAVTPNATPNVMPGPLNNPASGNAYAKSPAANPAPAHTYGHTPAANAYGRTPAGPAQGSGQPPADYNNAGYGYNNRGSFLSSAA